MSSNTNAFDERAGLVSFFEDKKAAAILKHAVLKRYLHPFAMKVGTYSQGNKVAFVDGYAGEGRYENGDPGSPLLVAGIAKALEPRRYLDLIFVEQDLDTFTKLEVALAEAGAERARVLCGATESYMPSVLRQTANMPAFYFLDPFGTIPISLVEQIFAARPAGPRAPATEVLINFNAGAIRRIAGHLTSEKGNANTLARMDESCGGSWWREAWLSNLPDKDAAEQAVVAGYASALAKRAKSGVWSTDVRNRPYLKPVYHLVFLTRHQDGMLLFGESLSSALEEWRAVITERQYANTLLDPKAVLADNEAALAQSWQDEIYENLKELLSLGHSFSIASKYSQVFGDSLGLAREKHLRHAWKRLHSEGATSTDSKGKLMEKVIEPPR